MGAGGLRGVFFDVFEASAFATPPAVPGLGCTTVNPAWRSSSNPVSTDDRRAVCGGGGGGGGGSWETSVVFRDVRGCLFLELFFLLGAFDLFSVFLSFLGLTAETDEFRLGILCIFLLWDREVFVFVLIDFERDASVAVVMVFVAFAVWTDTRGVLFADAAARLIFCVISVATLGLTSC